MRLYLRLVWSTMSTWRWWSTPGLAPATPTSSRVRSAPATPAAVEQDPGMDCVYRISHWEIAGWGQIVNICHFLSKYLLIWAEIWGWDPISTIHYSRIPFISVHNGNKYFYFGTRRGSSTWHKSTQNNIVQLGVWHKLEVRQFKIGDQVFYQRLFHNFFLKN